MPYFQTLGVPCAVGMLVAVAVALTLVPAVIVVGGRFGLFDPKRKIADAWLAAGRHGGGALAPADSCGGVRGCPHRPDNTARDTRPATTTASTYPHDIAANKGYDAAERHFSQARLMPEVMLVESDHDMRDPTDFLVLDKLAKGIFKVPGVSRVQAITRPEGTAMEHTSIPFQLSMQNAGQVQTMKFQKARMDDMLKQADELEVTLNRMKHMYGLMTKLTGVTHKMVGETKEMQAVTEELRDDIADFDDFYRPIRSYFYWEKHCYDIPSCWALRSVFNAIDGVDEIDEKFQVLTKDFDQLDSLMPQMIAEFPPMIDSMESMRTMMLTMHSTMSGIFGQMDEMSDNATAMGHAFDGAKNDDSFYLPPEVFKNKDFKRALNNFFSPDGKAMRLIISHRGDPATPEGIARIDLIKQAAEESLKGTPLRGRQDLPRRHRGHLQGLERRLEVRPVDRRNRFALFDFHHHADHHPKSYRRSGDRRHGGDIAGCLIRPVGAGVAVPAGIQVALDGAGDVRDHPSRGRIRLQPAAGVPVQRGNRGRAEDRHHPCHGRHRQSGDVRRSGVRLHHGDPWWSATCASSVR